MIARIRSFVGADSLHEAQLDGQLRQEQQSDILLRLEHDDLTVGGVGVRDRKDFRHDGSLGRTFGDPDLAVDHTVREFQASQDFFQGRAQGNAVDVGRDRRAGIDPGPFQSARIEFEGQAVFLGQELRELCQRQDFDVKGRFRPQRAHRRHVGGLRRLDSLGILGGRREGLGLLLGEEETAGRQGKTGADGSHSLASRRKTHCTLPGKTQGASLRC